MSFDDDSKPFSTIFFSVKIKLDGHELPNALPDHLVPPSKRHLTANENASLYPTIAASSGEQHSNGDS